MRTRDDAARLSDGDELDVEVALGSVRNTEWLRGAGLAADARGGCLRCVLSRL